MEEPNIDNGALDTSDFLVLLRISLFNPDELTRKFTGIALFRAMGSIEFNLADLQSISKLLINGLRSAKIDVIRLACEVITEFDSKFEVVVPDLVRCARQGEEKFFALAALKNYIAKNPDIVRPLMIEAASSDDGYERSIAFQSLAHCIEFEPARQILIRGLNDSRPINRFNAAVALLGDQEHMSSARRVLIEVSTNEEIASDIQKRALLLLS